MLKKRKYNPKVTKFTKVEGRTISKWFDDDECIGRLDNGDLVIKIGVKRKSFDKKELSLELESQINYYQIQDQRDRELLSTIQDIEEYDGIIEQVLDIEDRMTDYLN